MDWTEWDEEKNDMRYFYCCGGGSLEWTAVRERAHLFSPSSVFHQLRLRGCRQQRAMPQQNNSGLSGQRARAQVVDISAGKFSDHKRYSFLSSLACEISTYADNSHQSILHAFIRLLSGQWSTNYSVVEKILTIPLFWWSGFIMIYIFKKNLLVEIKPKLKAILWWK